MSEQANQCRKRTHGSPIVGGKNAKRSRVQLRAASTELMDMPPEILEHIFSLVESPQNLIISLQGITNQYTEYMMHRHRCFVYAHRKQRREGLREPMVRAALTVLQAATDYFKCGYESHFVFNLASFHVRMSKSTSISPICIHLKKFISEFLLSVEKPLGSHNRSALADSKMGAHQRRLRLTLTLINLLRQFRSFTIMSSGMRLMHWHLRIGVQSIFLRVADQRVRLRGLEHHIHIVGLIAEMLLHDQLNDPFYCIKTVDNFTYGYGLSMTRKRPNSMFFNFNILAPQSTLLVLQKAVDGEFDPTNVAHLTPDSAFNMRLVMTGKSKSQGLCTTDTFSLQF
ncbi:uncharacterized protein LOC117588353 [Drosophila guanche]|uniref:Uncharacterized protein n=1 Tax=Drosophila guanche TaxID=7266 RepID=A0A3B0KSI8_DROGU|nr:uncharacterized protein LOC117588353 [Drosophila guanche]SPP86858.1 Hypothetical predicted protein [Drosophila guanche]